MSGASRANTDFAPKLAVAATSRGTDHETAEPADDHRFEATLDATGLPDALEEHVLAPIEREVATPTGVAPVAFGPLPALLDAPGLTGPGPTLEQRGAYLGSAATTSGAVGVRRCRSRCLPDAYTYQTTTIAT